MNKLCRRAGRGQGGGDLASDMPAFADTGDDESPRRRSAQIERGAESTIERLGQLPQSVDFRLDHAAAYREIMRERHLLLDIGSGGRKTRKRIAHLMNRFAWSQSRTQRISP